MKKKFTSVIFGLLILSLLWSCGSENDSSTLRVGVQAGPELRLAEEAKKVAKAKFNLEVELVTFNDYVMPNEALQQRDIDINVFQTRPYLDGQSENRGYDFAVVGNTFIYPMAGYSKKIKSISELKNEDTVVIPNDPTNLGRALLLLQQAGLIKLNDKTGLLATKEDIIENKLRLNILELEAPQLPRTLDDATVSLAIINNNFAAAHNLMAKHDGIIVENSSSPYVNIIVSRQENKDDQRVLDFTKAYQSDEVDAVAEQVFKGGAIRGW